MSRSASSCALYAWVGCLLLLGCGEGGAGGPILPDGGADQAGDGHDHQHNYDASVYPDAEVDAEVEAAGNFVWSLPSGFPVPKVPADNPMSREKAELGRHLFYDKRLSGNGSQSCATCHRQELAFTDGRAQGLGSTGELHPRGPMSLANVAYFSELTWVNPLQRGLEQQALSPLFGEAPVELGLFGREPEVYAALRADAAYAQLFPAAFPGDVDPLDDAHVLQNITRALAAFERTLISGDAPFDRFMKGDRSALSEAAQRGMELFFGEELECFHCHGGFAFSDAVTFEGNVFDDVPHHNTGLYDLDGAGAYPTDNVGLYLFTKNPADMGRFRTPPLRNIAVTAPYMHDGSIATLEEVIDHYAAGGRAQGPLTSVLVAGFTIDEQQKADLVAFLHGLTDASFLTNPRFADPWAE